MARTSYSDGLYAAHVELARKYGEGSDFEIGFDSTLFRATGRIAHTEAGKKVAAPGILKIDVRVDATVRLEPVSSMRDIGLVDWRESSPYGLCRSRYFLTPEKTPKLYRSVLDYPDPTSPLLSKKPYEAARRIFDRYGSMLEEYVEGRDNRSYQALVDSGRAFVAEGTKRALSTVVFVVCADEVALSSEADVPYFQIVRQDISRSPDIDPARAEIVVTRDFESVADSWRFGMCFEPWEAEIAHQVMTAYGAGKYGPPRGLEALAEHAWDLAIVSRMRMNSLFPLFLKQAMLDLNGADFLGGHVSDAASVVYSAVSKNEWDSDEFASALSTLDDVWLADPRMAEFTRSMGWDIEISPFSIMSARLEAFPWRNPKPVASEAAVPSP